MFTQNYEEQAPKDENIFTSLWHIPVSSFHIASKESTSNPYALALTYIFTLLSTTSSFPSPSIIRQHNTSEKKKSLNKYMLNKKYSLCLFFCFLPCKARRDQTPLSRVPVILYSSVLCQDCLIRFISCCCHSAVESAIARSGLEFLLFCF